MNELSPPGGTSPIRPAPTPSWNTYTRNPYAASTEIRFIVIALSGTTMERKAITRTMKVTASTSGTTRLRLPKSSSSKSRMLALKPPMRTSRPASSAFFHEAERSSRTNAMTSSDSGTDRGTRKARADRPSSLTTRDASDCTGWGRSDFARMSARDGPSRARRSENPPAR